MEVHMIQPGVHKGRARRAPHESTRFSGQLVPYMFIASLTSGFLSTNSIRLPSGCSCVTQPRTGLGWMG